MSGTGTHVTEFLARQVELIHAGDAAGLSERYCEDAVLVRFDRVARGRTEIQAMLAHYMDGSPTVVEQQAVVMTEDVVLYRSLQRLRGVEVIAVGTFVFRNGLVWRQTAAFLDTDS
jgi:ketosteroid isomerase-like protein